MFFDTKFRHDETKLHQGLYSFIIHEKRRPAEFAGDKN